LGYLLIFHALESEYYIPERREILYNLYYNTTKDAELRAVFSHGWSNPACAGQNQPFAAPAAPFPLSQSLMQQLTSS